MTAEPLARNRDRSRRLALWVLFLSIAVGSIVASAPAAGRWLVVERVDGPRPQALLALASHEWERLPALATLARRYPDASVLLTQPVAPTEDNCYRCSERAAWLAGLGVSPQRIHLLGDRGRNTYDEAVAARAFCRERAISRLAVVTSPYHTRRALATFATVFEPSIAVSVHSVAGHSPAVPERWWARAYDRDYVAYEWAALVWYAVRYGVSPLARTCPGCGAAGPTGVDARPCEVRLA